MAPEYGATAAMFFIDQQTIDYLRLTGRDRRAGEAGRDLCEGSRPVGGQPDSTRQYERVLEFDLSSVVRNMAGPSNPHARVATSELAAKGIAGEPGRTDAGADARRRRDHRRDHELHEHQQSAQRDCRRPACAQREPARPHAQAVGEEFAGARFEDRCAVPRGSRAEIGARDSSASASSRSPAPPATACRVRSIR